MNLALVCDDLIQFGGAERLILALHEIWPEAPIFTSFASKAWLRRCRELEIGIRTSWMQKLPLKEKLFRHYFLLYPHAFESFDFNEFDVVLSVSARFAHSIITGPLTRHICYMNTPPRMFWEPFDYFGQPTRQPALVSQGGFLHLGGAPFDSPSAGSGSLRVTPEAFSYRRFHLRGVRQAATSKVFLRFTWDRTTLCLLSPFLSWLRVWDYNAAQRPDVIIANSKTPRERIKKYYGREAEVVYPFVDIERFDALLDSSTSEVSFGGRAEDYFLIVSRLQAWKRIDLAIEACNQLRLPLVVVGDGLDRKRLQRLAGPTIKFAGNLTDGDLIDYYYSCRALIFPQVEDFGITPLEAMAAGKPVIAARAGGALETVIEGKTGAFFWPQTAEALVEVLKDFDPEKYSERDCAAQAKKFGKKRFVDGMKEVVLNYS